MTSRLRSVGSGRLVGWSTLWFLALLLIAAASSVFLGCSKPRGLASQTTEGLGAISNRLEIDLYFDATTSMKGFIAKGESTSYAELVRLLESASLRAWLNSPIRYFKFGSDLREIQRDTLRDDIVKSDFYVDPSLYNTTQIQKVFDAIDSSRLTVIVTDLMQDESDSHLLVERLTQQLMRKGLSFGLLAVRGQYDGTVYDIGLRKLKFSYSSSDFAIRTYRPFFALIIGRHPDILHFYEQLQASGLSKLPETNFLVLSQTWFATPATFETMVTVKYSGLVVVSNLVNQSDNRGSRQFALRTDGVAGFSATFACTTLSYLPQLAKPDKVSVDATIWRFRDGEWSEFPEARRLITSSIKEYTPYSLSLDCQFLARSFPISETFVVSLQFKPTPDAFQLPRWIHSWDMDPMEIDSLERGEKSFDGSRTLNLRRFVEDTWQVLALNSQSSLAHLTWYFAN